MKNYLLIIMLIAIALGEDKQIITKTQTQGLGLSFSQQNLLALLGQTNVSSSIAQPSLYYILKKDNIKVMQAINVKNNILNLLNQYRNFNLTNTSVLQYFKTHPDYVR